MALQGGCRIYTDTRMAEAGINKKALKSLGCEIKCFIDHPQVAVMAKRNGHNPVHGFNNDGS